MGVIDRARTWAAQKLFDMVTAKSYQRLWGMGQEHRLFRDEGVHDAYSQLSNVYMAIRFIADNAGQVKLKFYAKGNLEKEVENEELQALFDNPNPMMSFGELMAATTIYFALFGESFWVFDKTVGQLAGTKRLPSEIWTFKPSCFKEVVDENERSILLWKYVNGRVRADYAPDEVMHVRDFHPNNTFRGFSPLEPLRHTMEIDYLSLVYNKAFFKNDATPGFILTSDKTLGTDQRDRILESWNATHKGASKAHRVAILEGGLKSETIGADHQKMQYLEQQKYNRETMLGMFRVPKAIFSITDDLNFATFQGQKKIFWTDTMMPLLRKIEVEINSQFFARFMPDLVCKFDFTEVMALVEEIKDKVDTAVKLAQMGFPINAVNERLGLGFDPVPWGDVWWASFGMQPIDSPEAPEMADPFAGEGEEEEGKKKKPDPDAKMIEAYEKMFMVKQYQLEFNMKRKIKTYFFEQRKRVMDSLQNEKAIITKRIGMNWGDEAEKFIKIMTPYIGEGIKQGALSAKELVGGDVNQEVLEGRLKSYLAIRKENTRPIIQRWGETIEDIITDRISEGATINEIAAELRDKFNIIGSKAQMIARTESTGALNGGSLQYYNVVGIKRKKWVSSRDEHVRESHKRLNGETVDIDKRFSNGLNFPGDDGPASEVANCRCSFVGKAI